MQNRDFKVLPSKRGILLLSLLAISTLLVFVFLPLQVYIKLPGLAVLLIYFSHLYSQSGLIKNINYKGDGRFHLITNKGIMEARVAGDSTLTSHVCILKFHVLDHKRTMSCILFRDSLKEDDYRKLLVILRIG